MKQTSPHTTALIERLNAPVTLREKITGSRDYKAILSGIADSNEPAAIIDVLPFVLAGKPDVAAAAVDAVHKLLRSVSVTDLTWLDSALRQRSPYSTTSFYKWRQLSPSQLDLLDRFGHRSVQLLGLASFHQNGYVREAAIERLSLIGTGAELPFLILRLNDWVSNVRDAAYKAIHSRVKPEYCRKLIENLALLKRVEQAGRIDHKEIIEAINELLQGDKCHALLLESLRSADRFIRRACFRLALDSTISDSQQLLKLALDNDDTVIRRWGAQQVSAVFDEATFGHFLDRMRQDRFTPVRREALRIAVKRNSPHLVEELHTALLDPNKSMREEALYHLRRIAPMDVAAFYRQHLHRAEEPTLYAVISGLGETGSVEDDRLILPYASHPASKIRRAAIKALAELRPEAHLDIFMSALTDEVPNVSRQSLKALSRKTSSVSAALVWELFSSTPRVHVKRHALSLIGKLAKWESIAYLVRALCETDQTVVMLSRFAIRRWSIRFNRSFSTPSAEQVARLRDALERCGRLLDEQTQAELWFSIKDY